ncbi:MAG: GGDEF domain-containing protein [Proteobacteria bacterium]|nr:GGDEF domain-containing protein [Pseudomonadota bacterium]
MDQADRLLLERSQLFCDIDLDGLEPLLDTCPETLLAAGDTLLQQDAPNNTLYLVLDGQLRVYLGRRELPEHTVLNPGECAGEMSLIDGRRASALVIAALDTRLLAIDHEMVWSLIELSYGIARNLLAILSGRIRFNNIALLSAQAQSLEFERASAVDVLTGLHNKRWVLDAFPRVISRCERDGTGLCLVLGDIDNFKQFNKSHGHLCGDNMLRLLARRLADVLRPQDMLARYGLEEFVFLLPATGLSGAVTIAERLRVMAAQVCLPLDKEGAEVSITLSLGIAVMRDGDRFETLLARAETAMRRAKVAGRNRVEVA